MAGLARDLLQPPPEVAAILAQHPKGWVGTILTEGERLDICLKGSFDGDPDSVVRVDEHFCFAARNNVAH